MIQIYPTTATARDRRKKIIAQIKFLVIKSPKTRKSAIICFSFSSSLNQYFPQIPYVASKKDDERAKISMKLFLRNRYKLYKISILKFLTHDDILFVSDEKTRVQFLRFGGLYCYNDLIFAVIFFIEQTYRGVVLVHH
jgi:hypothetical protein